MWCPNCKADVAAEVAADHRRVRCAHCGGEIPVPASLAGSTKTRDARELLERCASERTSEPALRGQTSRSAAVPSAGFPSDEIRSRPGGGEVDLAPEQSPASASR